MLTRNFGVVRTLDEFRYLKFSSIETGSDEKLVLTNNTDPKGNRFKSDLVEKW
jgi:hypothetical protein